MQEHKYRARDKTVQKMSRDGLREENLHSKSVKRITRREAEEEKVAGQRSREPDFRKAGERHLPEELSETKSGGVKTKIPM